jgi:hypothetical protein
MKLGLRNRDGEMRDDFILSSLPVADSTNLAHNRPA